MPFCRECMVKLATANGKPNIPRALANDNFYGFASEIIAKTGARWIECACASLCWTTVITYLIEEPYGHLMLESMVGPPGRVAARGNAFSFLMPYEDILKQLEAAMSNTSAVSLPHDGQVLACLIRVHIIGGSVDITKHLKDVHLRVPVVVALLHELIDRGFPGYVPTNEECERMGRTQAQLIRWLTLACKTLVGFN